MLLAGLLAVVFAAEPLWEWLTGFVRNGLREPPPLSSDAGAIVALTRQTLLDGLAHLFPLLAIMVGAGILVDLAQMGLLIVPRRLTPHWERIDPLQGFRRIFSLANLVRLVFGLLKFAVVAAVAAAVLWSEYEAILGLALLSVGEIAEYSGGLLLGLGLKVALALIFLAILDYGFQRWKHERDLRMTPQEVREELKHLEGDPQILARRRSVQRQLVLNRLSTAVPKADVVITNPTELAVALQYDPQTMEAPIVVAKGAGLLAQRIRQLAIEHSIPIVERKELAQALYREVDINRPIPRDKYAAVAEVLAYVYQLKGKKFPKAAA